MPAKVEVEFDRFMPSGPIGPTRPAAKTDKTTKNYHRKSPSRDARFHEERQTRQLALSSTASKEASVLTCPKVLSEARSSAVLAPTKNGTSPSSSKLLRRSRCDTWREQDKGHGGNSKHFVAALWRDLSFPGRLQEVGDTIFDEGQAIAITARLSPKIEAKALAATSTITYLEQRARYELRQSFRAHRLSAVPDFVLVLEQIYGRDTHLHGLLGAPASDFAEIRLCFRRACGEWKFARQHQVRTDENPDDGWISYMLKDRDKVRRLVRNMKLAAGNRMSITFNGKPFTATAGLRRRAQERYERLRRAPANVHVDAAKVSTL